MRIFKNKWFTRFARKEDIDDAKLCKVVKDAERGLIDADYGDGVIKQRISRPNEGKSGGYRAVILFQQGAKALFVYGFSKSQQDNINTAEEQEFKKMATITFGLTQEAFEKLLEEGIYKEVTCDDEEQDLQE